jgi:hypothetical protein
MSCFELSCRVPSEPKTSTTWLGDASPEKWLQMTVALVLFALAALGGATMAILRFKGRPQPPLALALVHGAGAAAALTSLIAFIAKNDAPGLATIALALAPRSCFDARLSGRCGSVSLLEPEHRRSFPYDELGRARQRSPRLELRGRPMLRATQRERGDACSRPGHVDCRCRLARRRAESRHCLEHRVASDGGSVLGATAQLAKDLKQSLVDFKHRLSP